MSDILTREEFLATLSEYCGLGRDFPDSVAQNPLSVSDTALRAVIQQAGEDVEKLPHAVMCASGYCARCGMRYPLSGKCPTIECQGGWGERKPCNCGHDAAIANLNKGLGEK